MKAILIISIVILRSIVSANFEEEFSHQSADNYGFRLPHLTTSDQDLLQKAVVELRSGNLLGAKLLLERTSLDAESKATLVRYATRTLLSQGNMKKRSLSETKERTEPNKAANPTVEITPPLTFILKPDGSNDTAKPYDVVGIRANKNQIQKTFQLFMDKLKQTEQQILKDPQTMDKIQKGINFVKNLLNNFEETLNNGNGLVSEKLAEMLGFQPPKLN